MKFLILKFECKCYFIIRVRAISLDIRYVLKLSNVPEGSRALALKYFIDRIYIDINKFQTCSWFVGLGCLPFVSMGRTFES